MLMKNYAEVNKEEFPIIRVTFTGESANDHNFPLYLDDVKMSYDNKSKIAIIFDATDAVLPGLAYQKMQAQWLEDNTQMMINFCVGTAYVIPNIIIRNVLKAIFAFQNQPVPYMICSDVKAAENWTKMQLS